MHNEVVQEEHPKEVGCNFTIIYSDENIFQAGHDAAEAIGDIRSPDSGTLYVGASDINGKGGGFTVGANWIFRGEDSHWYPIFTFSPYGGFGKESGPFAGLSLNWYFGDKQYRSSMLETRDYDRAYYATGGYSYGFITGSYYQNEYGKYLSLGGGVQTPSIGNFSAGISNTYIFWNPGY